MLLIQNGGPGAFPKEKHTECLEPTALFIEHGFLWTQLGALLTFLIIVTKYLIITNVRNKDFILAYSSRGTQFIAAGKRR